MNRLQAVDLMQIFSCGPRLADALATPGVQFPPSMTRERIADADSLSTLYHHRTSRRLRAVSLLHRFRQGLKSRDMDRLKKAAKVKVEDADLHFAEVPGQTERLLDQITAVKRRFSPQYRQYGTSRV